MRVLLSLLAGIALCGCVGGNGPDRNVKVSNSPGSDARSPLSESAIRSALAGKTFQYTRSNGNGIITYNADGTTELVDDASGSATGSWRADGGNLCESLNPSDAVPNGREEECQPFTTTGDAFYSGKARFVAM